MDLHAPLGSQPPPRRHERRTVWAVACLFVVCLVGGVSAYLAFADPRGGEPSAIALIPPAPVKPAPAPAATTDPTPTGSLATNREPSGDVVRIENGVKVVSPGAAAKDRAQQEHGPAPLVIDVSRALDSQAHKASSKSATPAFPGSTTRPRIAIFVSGLGLGDSQARTAIDTLPAAVSLAFVPYKDDIGATVASAKAKGHEILLQLPMESDRGSSPGPHSLRSTEPRAELAADLTWLLGRFDGYSGVTNLLGAPVTANAGTMTTVLKSVASRGVYYLDDGTSRRSLTAMLGPKLGIPTLQADVVLDATNDPAVVEANLERLVTIARARGSAIGMASGLSDHLGMIARFTGQLDTKGLMLVPVGDIARERSNVATSR